MKAGKMTKLIAGCCCFGMLTMYGEKDLAQEQGLSDYIEETEKWEIESLEENEETEDLEEITVENVPEEDEMQILGLDVETEQFTEVCISEENLVDTESSLETETKLEAERETEPESATDVKNETESEPATDVENETESESATDVENETESEPTTEAEWAPITDMETETDSEALAVTYEIEDQRLESGKTFEDIVVPECAIAEDGSEVDGEVQWKIPGCGIVVDSDMEISGEDGENLTWEWTFVPEEQGEYETVEGSVELTLYAAKKLDIKPLPDASAGNEQEHESKIETAPKKNTEKERKTASGSSTGSANVIKIPSVKDAAKWMGSAMTGVGKLGSGEDEEIRQMDEKLTISHGTIKREENSSKTEAILSEDKKEAESQEKEKVNRETVSGEEVSGAFKAKTDRKTDTISKTNPVDNAETTGVKKPTDNGITERKSKTATMLVKLPDTGNTKESGKIVIPGRFATDSGKMTEAVSVKAVSGTADHTDTGSMVQTSGFSGATGSQTGISRTGIFQNLWQMLGRGLLYMLFSGFGFWK